MTCTNSSKYIIEQLHGLIKQIKKSDYNRSLDVLNGSSVGQHFRHIFDFYDCVVKAAESGCLDYSKRDRSPSIEASTDMALSSLFKLQSHIDALDEDAKLKVTTDFQDQDSKQINTIVQSSVGRELMYAYDHAIHHLAIVKIGVKENLSYININDKIGVAPSTLRHKALQH